MDLDAPGALIWSLLVAVGRFVAENLSNANGQLFTRQFVLPQTPIGTSHMSGRCLFGYFFRVSAVSGAYPICTRR